MSAEKITEIFTDKVYELGFFQQDINELPIQKFFFIYSRCSDSDVELVRSNLAKLNAPITLLKLQLKKHVHKDRDAMCSRLVG